MSSLKIKPKIMQEEFNVSLNSIPASQGAPKELTNFSLIKSNYKEKYLNMHL